MITIGVVDTMFARYDMGAPPSRSLPRVLATEINSR